MVKKRLATRKQPSLSTEYARSMLELFHGIFVWDKTDRRKYNAKTFAGFDGAERSPKGGGRGMGGGGKKKREQKRSNSVAKKKNRIKKKRPRENTTELEYNPDQQRGEKRVKKPSYTQRNPYLQVDDGRKRQKELPLEWRKFYDNLQLEEESKIEILPPTGKFSTRYSGCKKQN